MPDFNAFDKLFLDWGAIVLIVGLAWQASRHARHTAQRKLFLRCGGLVGALWLMRSVGAGMSAGPVTSALKLAALAAVLVLSVSIFKSLSAIRRTP